MATTITTLIPSKQVENVQTSQYEPVGVIAIIDKLTVTNTSASNVSINVNLVTNGGSANDSNLIVKGYTIPPGKTYTFPEIVGHLLLAGDFISTLASAAAALTIRCSGREIN